MDICKSKDIWNDDFDYLGGKCKGGPPRPKRSFSDNIFERETLIGYQSFTTTLHSLTLSGSRLRGSFDILTPEEASLKISEEVKIDQSSRPGYFVRTSISDICEYRNGSVIHLVGKSGWQVYTKRLFLKRNRKDKENKAMEKFIVFPTETTSSGRTKHKSKKKSKGHKNEAKNLKFEEPPKQVLSDSSNIFPLASRTAGEENLMKYENKESKTDLNQDLRYLNNDGTDFRKKVKGDESYPNDLYLTGCKCAADRVTVCQDKEEPRCTCRRGSRNWRSSQNDRVGWQRGNVPLLFKDPEYQRKDKKSKTRVGLGFTLKNVFPEKCSASAISVRAYRSRDHRSSRLKRKLLSEMCKTGKSCQSRFEQFSMNDKNRNFRWQRSASEKKKENSDGAYGKIDRVTGERKCACCKCRPDHKCGTPGGRDEEVTGIRKILKDFGISGLSMGFVKKAPIGRNIFSRSGHESEPKPKKEELRRFDQARKTGEAVKVSGKDECPECVREPTSKADVIIFGKSFWERSIVESEGLRDVVAEESGGLGNSGAQNDIIFQRERIVECENLLRQFELKLEDVKRQNTTWSYRDAEPETQPQEEPVKDEPLMSSRVSVRNEEDTDKSEDFIKESSFEEQKAEANDEKTEECLHSLPSKIEIHSERTVCTCEKCRNIHYIDKHYLPTDVFKKCTKFEPGFKHESTIQTVRSMKENWTSTSEFIAEKSKDQYTSASDLISKKAETSSEVLIWPKKCDGISFTGRVSERDDRSTTTYKVKKEEGASSSSAQKKSEVASKSEITSKSEISKRDASSQSRQIKKEPSRTSTKKDDDSDGSKFGKPGSDNASENERLINKSDLDVYPSQGGRGDESSSNHSYQRRGQEKQCDCEELAESEKKDRFCDCSSKLKLLEDRLRMLEERKKPSEVTVTSSRDRKVLTEESSAHSEKAMKEETGSTSRSESVKNKESETSAQAEAEDQEKTEKSDDDDHSKSKKSSYSSIGSEKSKSLENIESETDVEVKTKIVTCDNMNFFEGDDPEHRVKCQCTEDSNCPFKAFPDQKKKISATTTTKNVFFVTNIDLLRHWSGLYGSNDFAYCKSFWNVNDSTLKPVKAQKDWRHVKATVADFFRTKLRKKKFKFKRSKKPESFSKPLSSDSDEFLDDCSRSSRPLKKRSFLILGESSGPARSDKERKRNSSRKSVANKKKRKKSRKKS